MGRHASGRRRNRLLVPAIATGLVLVVGAATWVIVSAVRPRPTCEQPAKVMVAASPDIAPALSLVVRDLALACGTIEVQSREATQVGEELAISDGGPRPQVWVPESTLELRRARQLGAADVPESGPSVAGSPVVLAVAEDVAKGLGWPNRSLSWADVLAPGVAGVVTGMPDPARDPVGAAALLGLRDTVKAVPEASAAYVALLRCFSANTLGAETDLIARLPGSSDGTGTAPVTVFPVSENALLRHNVTAGTSPLVASYSPAVPALDYPLAELGGISAAQRPIVDALWEAVLGSPGSDAIAKTGLRAAGGLALHTGDAHVAPEGKPSAPMPGEAEVDQLLNQWAGVNLSARVQVLIDVSGSMNAQVPGIGLNRMQVTLQAAAKAMRLFKPTTELRMLTFATRLDGDKDYREILPMAPVSQHLADGALDRLAQVKATPDGGTGLYDSVLDVYRTARREWQAGRLNLVIVMTDGRNDDPRGINRADLLAELGKLQDPRRPIPLIGVGIGPDADQAELTQLTAATGGQAFLAPDPAKITDVFFGALSRIAGG